MFALWPVLYSRGPTRADRGLVAALAFLACASHGVLDAMTDAGLGVGFWIPFDNTRTFFEWRPLRVSPIGIQRFFAGDAWPILASEARVLALPLVLLVAAGAGLDVGRKRRS